MAVLGISDHNIGISPRIRAIGFELARKVFKALQKHSKT